MWNITILEYPYNLCRKIYAVNRDVAQIDIPTLLDVRTYGDRLFIVFDKGEMRRFSVIIYNYKVYTRTYC